MKALFFLLIISLHVNALTLSLNSAEENKKPYATLHLIHNEPIQCEIDKQAFDKELYICAFAKISNNKVESKKTPLVDIDFINHEKRFYIQITPKFKSRILNMDANLYDDTEVPSLSKNRAQHWVVLIYQDLPYAKINTKDGINFPITYPELKRPSVGALDLNGAPIGYVRSKDINSYLDIKKSYENERYEIAIEMADEAMKKYPNTIFRSEFALYKVRAMDGLLDEDSKGIIAEELDYNDIVSAGKWWIKSFPSDENLPEMLMMITKAYLKMGFRSDADYFLDILISEHPESKYTKWAILLYGDTLYAGSKRPEALKLYNDVLYSAKDLDMASEAAIRLANNRIDQGEVTEAKEYLIKILNANAGFLIKDEENAYRLAEKLAANHLEDIAAQIGESLLKGVRKPNPVHETLLKDTGLWYAKASKVDKAYALLKEYQKEYQNGDFVNVVQEGLDQLFFELAETNTTKLDNYYNTLMERYDNEIGDKALLEKNKLLLSQNRYKEVLAFEPQLRQVADQNATEAIRLIEDAAFGEMQQALKEDQCLYAVQLGEGYPIADRLDDRKGLYTCYMRLSRYESALKEAASHIKHEDLQIRLEWLLRLQKVYYAMHEWQKTVDVGKDIEKLGEVLQNGKAGDALYERFFALMKLKQYNAAIAVVNKIEEINSTAFKNVEVYVALVNWAKLQGNDLLVETYASLALNIQDRHESHTYSPELEYDLIASLQRLGKVQDAKVIALGLVKIPLEGNQKTRAFYTIAELSLKLQEMDDAKNYFEQCVQSEEQNSWKGICEDNLKLLSR